MSLQSRRHISLSSKEIRNYWLSANKRQRLESNGADQESLKKGKKIISMDGSAWLHGA